jgi:hypothetical protein
MKNNFELVVTVTKNMITNVERDVEKAVKAENYSTAAEKDAYARGMSQALTNFEVSGVSEQLKKMEELLKFANEELSITQPYPDPESEYDECRICNCADFRHAPDCKGVEWLKNVQELLAEVGKK